MPRKTVSKKEDTKKTTPKKGSGKKSISAKKKSTSKEVTEKKTVTKKSSSKKNATKTPKKKAASKKKTTASKTTSKKTSPKKVTKKTTSKKVVNETPLFLKIYMEEPKEEVYSPRHAASVIPEEDVVNYSEESITEENPISSTNQEEMVEFDDNYAFNVDEYKKLYIEAEKPIYEEEKVSIENGSRPYIPKDNDDQSISSDVYKKDLIFKKKYNKKTANIMGIICLVVMFVVSFMTLGYSAFQELGVVSDIGASVKLQRDIRITGVGAINPLNGGLSDYEDYNVTSISSSLHLPNANSKITYGVEITNFGNVEMVLKEIEGLPSNLKYTIDSNSYVLDDLICDDTDASKCTLGAKKIIYVTVEYDDNGYDSSNTDYLLNLNFVFNAYDKVARIGNVYYQSLQSAIEDVPKDSTQTTVTLLKNTSEVITIYKSQNVILDLQSFTLSNDGNDNVIKNNGTLSISNGTISSNAATNGAINNNQNATITISGGRVIMTGGRQALYNDKGTATITGTAYLSSTASERAAVQNVATGTMYITGGTIISSGTYALNNLGTLVIGTQGGEMSITSPLIHSTAIGAFGVNTTTNISFFDGVVKARSNTPFNDLSKVTTVEDGYGVVSSTEVIDGVIYNVGHLGISIKVNFNGNGGTPSESVRYIEENHEIGTLPTATRTGYDFDGWYTASNGGTEINRTYVISSTSFKTFYAHWTQSADVAQIGETKYSTLAAAITAAPSDTLTTIQLLKNTSEVITVGSAKRIILDLNGKTLSNSGKNPIITTSGILTITNGTLSSNTTQGAINNTAGSLTIDDAEIIATGDRQSIYITGGTVTITGNSYLSSATYGKPSGSNMERGTVQVVDGTLIVEGGTIIGTNQQAISNQGTVIIGTEGGGVSTTTPVLRGLVSGIKSTGTLNFYDGIIEGGTTAVVGTITNYESGYVPTDGTTTISGKTYYTKYLDLSE